MVVVNRGREELDRALKEKHEQPGDHLAVRAARRGRRTRRRRRSAAAPPRRSSAPWRVRPAHGCCRGGSRRHQQPGRVGRRDDPRLRRALRTLRRALDSISSSGRFLVAGRSVTWLIRSSVRLCAGAGGRRLERVGDHRRGERTLGRGALVVGGDQRSPAPRSARQHRAVAPVERQRVVDAPSSSPVHISGRTPRTSPPSRRDEVLVPAAEMVHEQVAVGERVVDERARARATKSRYASRLRPSTRAPLRSRARPFSRNVRHQCSKLSSDQSSRRRFSRRRCGPRRARRTVRGSRNS